MMDLEYPDGATPIDPDEAEGLLLPHITTRGELDRWEQDNIIEALGWLAKNKTPEVLNEKFIFALHKRMFSNVWKWAGTFRQSDKNIGVPWYQVATSIRSLCEDASFWLEKKDTDPDEAAVWFHHRLVCVHPFPNGNGRHARLMTDLYLERLWDRPRFTWGQENLSAAGQVRSQYITALRAADKHDHSLLMEFVRS